MEEEMEELYVEGVATHDDPEPCVGVREGTGELCISRSAVSQPRPFRNPCERSEKHGS